MRKLFAFKLIRLISTVILLCCSVNASGQANDTEARILSAYHGLDALPPRARVLCGQQIAGEDGMPVVFSVQIDSESISPSAFAVETSSGELVTPLCATLRPAMESLEQRTVLLAGPFGSADSPPLAVEVVGELRDVAGNSLLGLRAEQITRLEAGPSVVLAERFQPDAEGLQGECPAATAQAILLTWEGGVTGPEGAALAEPQRTGIAIQLENGEVINPASLGDDDPDNHVIACVTESSTAVSVSVEAGLFHDPGDDANPETSIAVN